MINVIEFYTNIFDSYIDFFIYKQQNILELH